MFSEGGITGTVTTDSCPRAPHNSQDKFMYIGPTHIATTEIMADTISKENPPLIASSPHSKESFATPSDKNLSANKQQKASSSKLKQQELPIWQPVVTVRTVLPALFLIGILFIPVGVGFIYASEQVREVELDYTHCKDNKNYQESTEGEANCAKNGGKSISCQLLITKDQFGKTWTGKVFIYYGLENFFQNHRLYVKSRDDKQLAGDVAKDPDDNCKPFDKDENGLKYVPCGAIANSMFNDTISLEYRDKTGEKWKNVPVMKTGIALPSDKNTKFANPERKGNETVREAFIRDANVTGMSKPRDWRNNIWELDIDNDKNNGFLNEDFLVWMRTATLSTFRKLYRRVDHDNELNLSDAGKHFKDGLPQNLEYRINVKCHYDVAQFEGRKKVILSTTSVLGGKNNLIGVMYVMTGTLCLLLGIFFLILNRKYGAIDKQLKLKE